MIRLIDIRLNAAHPELPLCEAVTYTGAPSTVLIRGIPPNCGRWAITAVSVAATFPDGSTTTRAAVQSANGVWVATLPATATSGRTANGIRIMADGVDENGEAVTGYILGVADFAVASLAVTPAPEPGETSYQMLYFDEAPSVLRKGDVTKIDGVLKFYNGNAWESFAASVTLDDAVTRTSTNGVKSSGIWAALWGALTALPAGFASLYDWVVDQLAGKVPTSRTVNGKALTGDVTLTGADIPVSDMDATKINAALAGKANCVSHPTDGHLAALDANGDLTDSGKAPTDFALIGDIAPDWMMTTEIGTVFVADQLCSFSGRIYRCILGYTFNGEDVPLADTTHWALATVEDVLAALRTGKADTSALTAHTGNTAIHVTAADKATWSGKQAALSQAQLDAVNSGITAAKVSAYDGYAATIAGKADAADLRYALTTKTIDNGAVTLDDRAINAVAVSSSLASLTVNFPAATSGKARDFGVRLTVASGITTAPQLVLPQGVTCENADGTAPEIGADGAATILYFTETAAGVFLVKGEVVTAIS